MKYPFLFISAGFLAGIILQQYWDCPVPWILALLLTGLTGLWWIRGKKLFFPILAVLFICEGWLCAEFDRQQPFNAVENYIQPRPMVLTGTVRSLPEVKIKGKRLRVSFVLTAEKAEIRKGRHSRIFPVQGDVQAFLLQPSFIPQVGDRIRLRGKLEKPRPALNFGEFEYGRYLAQKRIFSIFETLGKRNATFIEVNQGQWFWRFMAHLRQGIAKRIDQIYPFKEASLLKALIVGIRSDVGPQVRDQFMKTGTVHLLAISGLNITMIAGSFYLFFLILRLNCRAAAALCAGIVAFYIVLSGAGIPVQRAGYVAIVIFLGIVFGRRTQLFNALCFAFFTLLLINTQNLWDVGFQLSFLSVFSLILILPFMAKLNLWSLSLGSSLAVLVGTSPLVLYYFSVFSPVSLIANLLAIPLFDAALLSGLFSVLFFWVPILGDILVRFSSWILQLGMGWISFLSGWDWGYWFLPPPGLLPLLLYYSTVIGVLFAARVSGRRRYKFLFPAIGLWIISLVGIFGRQPPSEELTFFSSGKNLIMHIQWSPKCHWMINAGRGKPSDQGEWLTGPYLRKKGIKTLDVLLLTDPYKKHIGALPVLSKNFSIKKLYGSRYLLHKSLFPLGGKADAEFKGLNIYSSGETLQIRENAFIKVFASNARGVVLEVVMEGWKFLIFSRLDSELILDVLRSSLISDAQILYFPEVQNQQPVYFDGLLKKIRPKILVTASMEDEKAKALFLNGFLPLNLKDSGSISFKKQGERLVVKSFLQGEVRVLSK